RTAAQFERFAGEPVRVELKRALDGRRRFKGEIAGVEADAVLVAEDGRTWRFPLRDIAEARLVPQVGKRSGGRTMSKEILLVVDAVSNEKGVDKEVIFQAIEAALASATRKRYGEDIDVRVSIDRTTGDYQTFRRWKVFADDSAELTEPARELRLQDALEIDPNAQPGDYVEEPMESRSEERRGGKKFISSFISSETVRT